MGCRGRPLFDLNEPPTVDDEENEGVICFQPQKMLPSSYPLTADLFVVPEGCQTIVNNHAFSHASLVSGFRPFIRAKDEKNSKGHASQKSDASNSGCGQPSTLVNSSGDNKVMQLLTSGDVDVRAVEREEGEWSDMDGSSDNFRCNTSTKHEEMVTGYVETAQKQEVGERTDLLDPGKSSENISNDVGPIDSIKGEGLDAVKDENSRASLVSEQESFERSHNNSKNSDGNFLGQVPADGSEESSLVIKQKDVKVVETSQALKCPNNLAKKHKMDQHKEAMLGKKRSRQTMFLNLEDVKQAGPIKTSTPRRQMSSSNIFIRSVKETRNILAPPERTGERQGQSVLKDQKQAEADGTDGSASLEFNDYKTEINGDVTSGPQARPTRLNSGNDFRTEIHLPSVPRQGLWKQSTDTRQFKNQQVATRKPAVTGQNRESIEVKSSNKKHPPLKKQTANSTQYQDTSVERLLREVTNDKFWHHPGETELQCVPGRFESVEEYVRVFEPLLFEECRAQLYSTWEELTETISRDAHIMVRIKNVERREREQYFSQQAIVWYIGV